MLGSGGKRLFLQPAPAVANTGYIVHRWADRVQLQGQPGYQMDEKAITLTTEIGGVGAARHDGDENCARAALKARVANSSAGLFNRSSEKTSPPQGPV